MEVETMVYVGLDIHKKSISFCVRRAEGTILQQGSVPATRAALDEWVPSLPSPWTAGMEATLFTAWVYDHLVATGMKVKVAHPAMLKAIFAGKRKNDRIDAQKLADLLRCDYFPECHIAAKEIRDRRRILRYRILLVRQSTQTKNKLSGLLMEAGIPYNKQKLHHSKKYFQQLVDEQKAEMPEALPGLLGLGRNVIDVLRAMDRQLLRSLKADPSLVDRLQRLMTIPGVGPILALTWALEIGEVQRFPSIKAAISYCGLCGSEQSSAGKTQRTPISKQRNKHLQSTLIEAAKVAPRWHAEFALLYEHEKQKGNRNRATLAIARKLVAYLLAVDRAQRSFEPQAPARAGSVVAGA
jgi:transposase